MQHAIQHIVRIERRTPVGTENEILGLELIWTKLPKTLDHGRIDEYLLTGSARFWWSRMTLVIGFDHGDRSFKPIDRSPPETKNLSASKT